MLRSYRRKEMRRL